MVGCVTSDSTGNRVVLMRGMFRKWGHMPRSILAAIDLAASSDQVLAAAQEYAEAFSAKVYLVHVAHLAPAAEPALADDDALPFR